MKSYCVPVTGEDRIKAGLTLHLVAATTGVDQKQMTTRARLTGVACRARWLALYLAHVTFGWPVERVSHVFGVSRATAAKACIWVEEARDQPLLDDLLERLERCARLVTDARVEL